MLSYKRCFINTDTANRIDSLLESKSKTAKKEVKEIIEGIDVFYIIPNGVKAADYHELIFTSEYDSVLVVTYTEFERIKSNKTLKRIIETKITMDLRRWITFLKT